MELPNPDEIQELKERRFTRRVALTTAVYAVVLPVTSLGGNNAMKEMILAQQQASDQWAYYQAKAIREHLYRLERMRLEARMQEMECAVETDRRGPSSEFKRWVENEERRLNKEKREIEAEARRFEHERDLNREKDPYFDYAQVLLQIAIVIATLAILSGSFSVYFFSMVLAGIRSIFSLNGFFLVMRIAW